MPRWSGYLSVENRGMSGGGDARVADQVLAFSDPTRILRRKIDSALAPATSESPCSPGTSSGPRAGATLLKNRRLRFKRISQGTEMTEPAVGSVEEARSCLPEGEHRSDRP